MRFFLRLLGWLAAGVGALLLLLISSILFDALIDGGRVDALTNTVINSADGPSVRAHVAQPPGEDRGEGPHPAVIMIHDFRGVSADVNSKADLLAAEGYVVVAPDTYRGAVSRWFPRSLYLTITTPTERVNEDLAVVFAWLASQPNVDPQRIAVQGFCYGGGKALRYSLTNPDLAATAVFYGSLIDDPAVLKALTAPVLGIFGAEDTMPSPEEVAEFEAGLTAADVPNQVTLYPNEGHGFVENAQTIQRDPEQGAAWAEFVAFLDETLR